MLNEKDSMSFKKAVFLVENAYLNKKIDFEKFNEYLTDLSSLARDWMAFNHLINYRYSDSLQVLKNLAIYKVLKDTIRVYTSRDSGFAHIPYFYDFDDFFGDNDWRNMFVTKLLAYHTGNCHSLPYLYKILADEMSAPCWLALAPNHMYIENRCKKIGWYNTELTSGDFPIDAWIMGSGYIPVEAVQNGIWMDTLSTKQSVALCVLDLAKGDEHKTRNYIDGFILQCCDLSLKYFPKNIQAMLLKAETLKRIYEGQAKKKNGESKATYKEMEGLYVKLFTLGYREMPEKMYIQWPQSVIKERDKYTNRMVQDVIPTK